MKRMFFGMLLLTIFSTGGSGCNRNDSLSTPAFVPSAEVGAFQLKIDFNPNPPGRGENEISLTIFQNGGTPPALGTPSAGVTTPAGGGEPVRPDHIAIYAVMPAMATMSEMRSDIKLEWQKNGVGVGRLLLGMGGTWFLNVDFTPPGQSLHQARFKLVTGSPGLMFLSGRVAGVATPMGEKPNDNVMTSADVTMSVGVVISPARLQAIGVKTTTVKRRPLTKTIRMQGRVTYDERTRSEVALKFSGFVGEVFVGFVGKHVAQGTPLFTVYSPELSVTLSEYLNLFAADKIQQTPSAFSEQGTRGRFAGLISTARKKLILWDLTASQIDQIVQTGEVPQYLPILAPTSGIVVEKQIVRGSPVMAGQILYRLADLATVWIEAEVYESELSLIKKGLPVKVRPIGLPGVTLKGSVSFITPELNPESRAGSVRIEAKNPDLKLLPEMSVTVETAITLGGRLMGDVPLAGDAPLSVPKDAIIYAGDKKFVFIDQGGGRFMPRFVTIGRKGDEGYEVISGLSEGERVVTSGNFLIAAESRLTSGLSTFLEGREESKQ